MLQLFTNRQENFQHLQLQCLDGLEQGRRISRAVFLALTHQYGTTPMFAMPNGEPLTH